MLKGKIFKWFDKKSLKNNDVDKYVKGKKSEANIVTDKTSVEDDKVDIGRPCWKKKCIFWDLLYWSTLYVWYVLNVIEGRVWQSYLDLTWYSQKNQR